MAAVRCNNDGGNRRRLENFGFVVDWPDRSRVRRGYVLASCERSARVKVLRGLRGARRDEAFVSLERSASL